MVAPALSGNITPADLLRPMGNVIVRLQQRDLTRGFFFKVEGFGFSFALSFGDGSVFLRRNEDFVAVSPHFPLGESLVFASWTPERLRLVCDAAGGDEEVDETVTGLTPVPIGLVREARARNLIGSSSFPSEEAFRESAYQVIEDVRSDVRATGA